MNTLKKIIGITALSIIILFALFISLFLNEIDAKLSGYSIIPVSNKQHDGLSHFEIQTNTKIEAFNCAVANLTSVYNDKNKKNITVDEMRDIWNKHNEGLTFQEQKELALKVGLKAEIKIIKYTETNIKNIIEKNDYVLAAVSNKNISANEKIEKYTPNHSIILNGFHYDDEGNLLFDIINPNYTHQFSYTYEELEKYTPMPIGIATMILTING